MIEIKNLSKKYKSKSGVMTTALDNISLKLPKRGLIAIVGKSGSGKSTLLNIIGGLDKADQGEILLNKKDVLKFKGKKLNLYRNTYLGFIFQDYNLISNLNVKENLEVALELQKQKNDNFQVEEILKKIDLSGYEKRKVNELSGGQKQRIAIARALIKEPQILLADEPTGNLDTQTSKDIFELLKEISKEKLVILITHDYESAKKYSDGICEISDGKITKNTISEIEDVDSDLKLRKGRLTFFKSIKYAFVNLRKKKIRLIFTTFIMTCTLFALSFLLMLINFDVNKIHSETLINNGNTNLTVVKESSFNSYEAFTEDELIQISKLVSSELTYYPIIVSDNNYTGLELRTSWYATDEKKEEMEDAYKNAYNTYYVTSFVLNQLTDDKLNELNIIGSIPDEPNEVLISQYLADQLVTFGVMSKYEISVDGTLIESSGAIFFDDYEDIISNDLPIYIDDNYETEIIITGIIIEDTLEDYYSLKDILANDMDINPTVLFSEFIENIYPSLNVLTVSENFTETMVISENSELDTSFYPIVYILDGTRTYLNYKTSYITDKISIYNGSNTISISSLDEDEIILSQVSITQLYSSYNEELSNYISNLMTVYKTKVEEYNVNIAIEEEKVSEDSEYIPIEYDYPEDYDYEEEYENFFYDFIEENNIIGESISIEITDLNDDSEETRIETTDLTVVGVYYSEGDNNVYISENILLDYERSNFEITEVYFEINSEETLLSIFNTFDENDEYVLISSYSSVMEDLSEVVVNVEQIAKYVSIGVLIFTIILFMNFIVNSINSRKKDVGILRAIGASSFDIYKMFYLESTIIAVLSLSFATVLSIIGSGIANNIISNYVFIDVLPIEYNYSIIFYMIIFIFVFVTLVSMIGLLNISKVRPIKLINDK